MPTKPKIVSLTNSSTAILNAIRNSASVDYRNYVPYANPDLKSIRAIGSIIMDMPSLQNEFLNVLINRIGRVWVTSKLYENPLRMFKKGIMEMGETIEEVFVNLIDPETFDPETAETELYKRAKPDVKSAFHIMNYQEFYKVTISYDELKQAFLTESGLFDLTGKIVEKMYTSANYDEFLVMKYLIALNLLNGKIKAETDMGTAQKLALRIKEYSNNFTFMSPDYNMAGVYNHTPKNEQYLLIKSEAQALLDINILAVAFNMDKAEFMGHTVLIDGFHKLDITRLNKLLGDYPEYVEIPQDDLDLLENVQAILVDKDFFVVVDNLISTKEKENSQGLYWNYFLHTWKTFSISPFANAVSFGPVVKLTAIALTPNALTVGANYTGGFAINPSFTPTSLANHEVTWAVTTDLSGHAGLSVTVTPAGWVEVAHTGDTTEYNATVKISCTSVADTTKTAEFTLTIGTGD